jgi:hypothetical protein
MSGKNDVNLDDNIFTFKPKASSASAKIVENLGTDFMAQKIPQHICYYTVITTKVEDVH